MGKYKYLVKDKDTNNEKVTESQAHIQILTKIANELAESNRLNRIFINKKINEFGENAEVDEA